MELGLLKIVTYFSRWQCVTNRTYMPIKLLLLRGFLEEDALSRVFIGVGRQLVVREFGRIDDVFGIAEPLGPPLRAVLGNPADEEVTRFALDSIFSQFDTEALDSDFHDKLPLGNDRRLCHQLSAQVEELPPRGAISHLGSAAQDVASLRLTMVNTLPESGANSKSTSSIIWRMKYNPRPPPVRSSSAAWTSGSGEACASFSAKCWRDFARRLADKM